MSTFSKLLYLIYDFYFFFRQRFRVFFFFCNYPREIKSHPSIKLLAVYDEFQNWNLSSFGCYDHRGSIAFGLFFPKTEPNVKLTVSFQQYSSIRCFNRFISCKRFSIFLPVCYHTDCRFVSNLNKVILSRRYWYLSNLKFGHFNIFSNCTWKRFCY